MLEKDQEITQLEHDFHRFEVSPPATFYSESYIALLRPIQEGSILSVVVRNKVDGLAPPLNSFISQGQELVARLVRDR